VRHSSGNSVRRLLIGKGLKFMSSTPSLALQPAAGISGWLGSPPAPRPSLEQDLRADVVIVGAGYNGLSAALELRTRGIDPVVLERDFAGSALAGAMPAISLREAASNSA
jgi:gamma-glutamylputrescine oxidase